MKIRGGPHLTSCQESGLIHAAGKGKKSCFLQDTVHFPRTWKRFTLAPTTNCPCGNINGIPSHYATECSLNASFHMTKPAQQHEPICFRNIASNKDF
ncbi:hypothetical protein AVEN_258864-1 [Araneus ventricosus]|uniref:Uncharacterized protein n=1 Tax=Araneus ventricosus TaxID=182803 RepID=A0A4Y2QTB5_ARAVE|nr:hypothetical protein AVEN_258864-1 [Araneus ventricosus]